ncbi:MAG: DUF2497 domain-containing protein [Alphaproteobacteria bacterium]|nr:DUF2497 domain-containing protein [Alphaproteobacteria bacterium]
MQEEEMSVSEILSSIREVLSKEVKDEFAEITTKTIPDRPIEQMPAESVKPPVFHQSDIVLELTPQMRVEKDSFLPLNASLSGNKSACQPVCAPEGIEANLQPMMQAWLDKNLPEIVEKVVAREVKRLFSGK